MDTLKGGTVQRIAKMRRYRDEWNAKQASGERRYSGRQRLADGMAGILQARSHGVGKIASDAHGVHIAERADSASIPSSVLDGLRFVGFADDIARGIDHSGWFADAWQGEKYRGAVWQLPARAGQCLFIAGYTENEASGYTVVRIRGRSPEIFVGDPESDGDRSDAAKDAARDADSLAEREAETAREYDEKWQAASTANDDRGTAREELKQARAEASNAIMALRQQRAGTGYVAPMVCDLIRAKLDECRDDMRRAIKTIAEKTDEIADLEMQGEFA